MAEDKKYFVCKILGHYLTLDLKPEYERVLFEGTDKECYEFVKNELENGGFTMNEIIQKADKILSGEY